MGSDPEVLGLAFDACDNQVLPLEAMALAQKPIKKEST